MMPDAPLLAATAADRATMTSTLNMADLVYRVCVSVCQSREGEHLSVSTSIPSVQGIFVSVFTLNDVF